jgi:hypothetical protein
MVQIEYICILVYILIHHIATAVSYSFVQIHHNLSLFHVHLHCLQF